MVVFTVVLIANSEVESFIEKKLSDYKQEELSNLKTGNFWSHNSVIVYGNNSDKEDESYMNKLIANETKFRIEKWLGKTGKVKTVIDDKHLRKKMIEELNLILVGNPETNIIIKSIMKYLPVEFDNNIIKFAGDSFEGEVGIMLKFPNPLNPDRFVWLISAPLAENIRFIPKSTDYVIYKVTDYNPKSDRFLELAMGDFDKNWQIDSIDYVDNEKVATGENKPINVGEIRDFPSPEWIKHGVMYEIFVRSFYDSDDDGIGDLKGIVEKLDYLNDGDPKTDSDLGIKLIWLMPILDSPSYHGYDVINYKRINPDYGTNEDFQLLLKEAHKRGIKVITDLVLNHCSSQHPFFKSAYDNPESKYDRWFYFSNSSNTRAHNWYFRDDPNDRGMLDPYMPAWNVNNPEVIDYLVDTAKYWMDPNGDGSFDDGVDGFRCDYVKGPPHEFWKILHRELKTENPDLLLLGEIWADTKTIADYFDNEFDMAFDFPFQGNISGAISSGSNREFYRFIKRQKESLPENAVMNRFINNHDMNRIFTRMKTGKAKIALSTLLMFPGMPMLYYGDEIGMKGRKDPYDEGIRRPMEWCANNDCKGMTNWYPVWSQERYGISVEEELNNNNSILHFVMEMIN